MRPRSYFLEGLLDLHTFDDPGLRRGLFRQSIASIGLASPDGPGPLDGLSPEALARSVKIALDDGLLDDLGWLAPDTAAVALYEIAGALPLGHERRELGRRVMARLYEGHAATFVAVATRMAAGSARALSGAGIRARVALSLCLPSRADVAVDPLALALASRRDLARDWIVEASAGSLPDRRLAARLLERAAREAARRSGHGDDRATYPFLGIVGAQTISRGRPGEDAGQRAMQGADTIGAAWRTLLADRETLVWRHVAAARGLLSSALPELAAQTEAMLAPDLSPTEWRRGATSLVASIAVDPHRALRRAKELLHGPLLDRDPGIATAMAWGLARAADVEPEATEELLDELVALAPIAIAESLVELRLEVGSFGVAARGVCIEALRASLAAKQDDDGLDALARAILRDLTHEKGTAGELREAIQIAVDAFVDVGSREAHARAEDALAIARETVTALEALDVDATEASWAGMSRRASVGLLRDLDASLLENGVLGRLLLLDQGAHDAGPSSTPVDDLDERLAAWLIAAESRPAAVADELVHVTLHQRQLRALLHLLDGAATDHDDDQERRGRARERWRLASRMLMRRLLGERASPLRRTVAATLARAFDALVRDGAADAADVLLHTTMRLGDLADVEVLAEASTHVDVTYLLGIYAAFARRTDARSGGPPIAERVAALGSFVTGIPAEASQRTDALRGALGRLTRALEAVLAASSLHALVDGAGTEAAPLVAVDDGLAQLAQLAAGAAQRLGDTGARESGPPRPVAHPLPVAVARCMQGLPDGQEELVWSIGAVARSARAGVPSSIANVVTAVLARLSTLPSKRRSQPAPSDHGGVDSVLPAWLPSRRTLGGFYVQRKLGGGAVGSVFMVTRVEERHDDRAERFALKVPDYDATAARSLSEAEFLKLFREEAGALLSLPEHPNLARFVTFDAGARPKPILVMELIEGARCDQLLDERSLTIPSSLSLLDGVLAGLEAMHAVGIGHLDVKPSNIVLRAAHEPVLVDFGLAGRHLRPGCATGCYGAPEVWGIVVDGAPATPLTADVYSFGCLAFEVLTGRTLFDAPNEVALVSAHLVHDGAPAPLQQLGADARLSPLVALLRKCLRHSPRDRASIAVVRRELRALAAGLAPAAWPLGRAHAHAG